MPILSFIGEPRFSVEIPGPELGSFAFERV
jgi:hypothetical protein